MWAFALPLFGKEKKKKCIIKLSMMLNCIQTCIQLYFDPEFINSVLQIVQNSFTKSKIFQLMRGGTSPSDFERRFALNFCPPPLFKNVPRSLPPEKNQGIALKSDHTVKCESVL